MDFLSRLIGGVGGTPNRKSSANNPQQRLQRFKKTYNQALVSTLAQSLRLNNLLTSCQQAFNKITLVRSDPASVDTIRVCFNRLTTLLHDDSRAPAPHLCLSFAASPQVFSAIATIASRLNNDDVVREAVAIYSALVDSDEENLLSNERFAKELMSFVDTLMEGGSRVGRQAEGEILELAFGIAAKIRLEPDLLPVWFTPNHDSSDDAVFGKAVTLPPGDRRAFPLCHQFVGHVYHEGRAGDFARTGLLYIFETASHYNGLESWIVNSELPTLMATGLGALYSQLSRKLAIAHPDDRLPLVLALSDNDHHPLAADADSFYAEGLQERLQTFMSNLVFWQDILEHCRSLEIKQTLIDHFQVFFLQQILYPSLLESSDIDGGSSVAVLTYLWRILDSVDHPDIIHLVLNYLMAISDNLESPTVMARSGSAERRRKSLLSASDTNGSGDQLNPSFFNLVDLINGSVRSNNVETVTAALRLVTVIFSKHHQHAISSLVRSVPFRHASLTRSIGTLRRDMEAYLALAQAIGGEDGMDDSYDSCLKDSLAMIEGHVCSSTKLGLIGTNVTDGKRRGAILDNRPNLHDHLLVLEDPLLQALMSRLKTFFTNDIETNLELTQVVSHLASCPYTRLEGWLVADIPRRKARSRQPTLNPEDSLASLQDADIATLEGREATEEERMAALKSATRHTGSSEEDDPTMLQILRELQTQLIAVKTTITDMEAFVKGRKRAFQGATEIENELRSAAPSILSPRLSRSASRESSRARGSGFDTPTKQRSLHPSTPRGRPLPRRAMNSPTPNTPAHPGLNSRPLSPTPPTPARALSPLKSSFTPADMVVGAPEAPESRRSLDAAFLAPEAEEEEEIFERTLYFPFVQDRSTPVGEKEVHEDTTKAGQDGSVDVKGATLNHVLTNVIILQEFVLEIAALIHVRSSLLEGEIKFV